MIFSGRGDFIA